MRASRTRPSSASSAREKAVCIPTLARQVAVSRNVLAKALQRLLLFLLEPADVTITQDALQRGVRAFGLLEFARGTLRSARRAPRTQPRKTKVRPSTPDAARAAPHVLDDLGLLLAASAQVTLSFTLCCDLRLAPRKISIDSR